MRSRTHQATYHFIDESLKGLSGIPKPKRHVREFQKAKWSGDGGLWDILWAHGYLIISLHQIKRREY